MNLEDHRNPLDKYINGVSPRRLTLQTKNWLTWAPVPALASAPAQDGG